METARINLLNPEHLQANYVPQLRQTIDAYSPAYIFVGEALQNALDAVREKGGGAIDALRVDAET